MAADESTEHAGLSAATDKGTAANATDGAHQHVATQIPEEEGQNHAVPEKDVCDARQIHGVTFQAPWEASSVAPGFPPPNDADESTEHAPVAAAGVADDTARDQEEVPEPESAPQLADPVSTETETGSTSAADDAQAHQGSHHRRRRPMSVEFPLEVLRTVRDLRERGNPDNDSEILPLAVAMTLRSRLPWLGELPSYRNGGFGAVPASAAAVAALEKRVFHAGGDDHGGCACAICLEDEFEEGQELSVMPCANGHAFHTTCITAWLGQSNMCPLCRHALPASED